MNENEDYDAELANFQARDSERNTYDRAPNEGATSKHWYEVEAIDNKKHIINCDTYTVSPDGVLIMHNDCGPDARIATFASGQWVCVSRCTAPASLSSAPRSSESKPRYYKFEISIPGKYIHEVGTGYHEDSSGYLHIENNRGTDMDAIFPKWSSISVVNDKHWKTGYDDPESSVF